MFYSQGGLNVLPIMTNGDSEIAYSVPMGEVISAMTYMD